MFRGTKIFSENFVPPEQISPEQNSSDRTFGIGSGADVHPLEEVSRCIVVLSSGYKKIGA